MVIEPDARRATVRDKSFIGIRRHEPQGPFAEWSITIMRKACDALMVFRLKKVCL